MIGVITILVAGWLYVAGVITLTGGQAGVMVALTVLEILLEESLLPRHETLQRHEERC